MKRYLALPQIYARYGRRKHNARQYSPGVEGATKALAHMAQRARMTAKNFMVSRNEVLAIKISLVLSRFRDSTSCSRPGHQQHAPSHEKRF